MRAAVLSTDAAFDQTVALLSLPSPPTALFVAAMDVLGGTLRALRHLNRPVGAGISVVAGSDSELAELYAPPITAVVWDLARMGRLAATMLLERITGRAAEARDGMVVPTMLTVRESCRRIVPR